MNGFGRPTINAVASLPLPAGLRTRRLDSIMSSHSILTYLTSAVGDCRDHQKVFFPLLPRPQRLPPRQLPCS